MLLHLLKFVSFKQGSACKFFKPRAKGTPHVQHMPSVMTKGWAASEHDFLNHVHVNLCTACFFPHRICHPGSD